jgi:copper ion binding protein
MEKITFNVPNISCGHCVHTIQTELGELEGVANVMASAETKQVAVEFNAPADEKIIRETLLEINYPAAV